MSNVVTTPVECKPDRDRAVRMAIAALHRAESAIEGPAGEIFLW